LTKGTSGPSKESLALNKSRCGIKLTNTAIDSDKVGMTNPGREPRKNQGPWTKRKKLLQWAVFACYSRVYCSLLTYLPSFFG